MSGVQVGQIWETRAGTRLRVQGFSKTDRGWVKVRKIGGERWRHTYPPAPFVNGAFRLVEDVRK